MSPPPRKLRPRQLFGQYRIQRRLAVGGFATVYAATDLIAERPVALKVLNEEGVTFESIQRDVDGPLSDIKREVRMAARLRHQNVLEIRHATVIEDRFVLVTGLAEESLEDRLTRRLGPRLAMDISGQLLEGLAHAHGKKVVHCDVKPENVLLFADGGARIADFGLARVDQGRILASGSGTIGFMAPEQAFGRPSLRSDVFAAGLVMYRMFSGTLPEWPFERPFPGMPRVRTSLHRDMIELILKAVQVDQRKRFASCVPMLAAFKKARRTALRQDHQRTR